MDNEKLKKFGLPIAILVFNILILCLLLPKVINNFGTIGASKSNIEAKRQELSDKQTRLEQYRKREAEEARRASEANSGDTSKSFYKPTATGMDTEAVIAGEFTEILELIRANKIKVRSIKYDYDPKDDNFVKGAGASYNVARLNMEMIGSYINYDNFLKELYKHEHFLDIQSVEIVPYRKNKRISLINFKLKLYSKK